MEFDDLQIIARAWPDILAEFVATASDELLLMSPWITSGAARLISNSLTKSRPVQVHVLARMDERDFMSGASHIEAFRRSTYPAQCLIRMRALPMLHAKLLVSDRHRVIIGSANLTDGGLFRNHEICLYLRSPLIGSQCANLFFEFWSKGTEVPEDYLSEIEKAISSQLPLGDEEQTDLGQIPPRRRGISPKSIRNFRHVKPEGAEEAQRKMDELTALESMVEISPLEVKDPMTWLMRLKFMPKHEREDVQTVKKLESLMRHQDISVRATAIDRAGRARNIAFISSLKGFVTNPNEVEEVRSAAVFSLGTIGAPESFTVLAGLIDLGGHVGRWARRGCFLLLDAVDHESKMWLFNALHVEDRSRILYLIKQTNPRDGTVSERLAKALIIEKLATAEWSESDVIAVTHIVKALSIICRESGRIPQLNMIIKLAAEGLRVTRGDLRHGPLSPMLLKRISGSGMLEQGLSFLLEPTWSAIESIGNSIDYLSRAGEPFAEIIRFVSIA